MIRPNSTISVSRGIRAKRLRRIRQRASLAASLVLPIACCFGGCSRSPQFPAKDLRLLEALRTAVSARKPEWLAASAKQIDTAHKQGEISDEGFDALQSSIAHAQSGDWTRADKQIVELEKGQRPPAK